MESVSKFAYHPGLEGIIAAKTRLSRVDGERGQLTLAGYAVEDLAVASGFEEVVHLLWYDHLPDQSQLSVFKQALANCRALSAATIELLRAAAEAEVTTMDALRMGAASLGLNSPSPGNEEAMTLVATFSTMVAAFWRLKQSQEPIEPRQDLNHAANFLFMLRGDIPSAGEIRALERYLITVCDHGLNASTFTARVILSTRSEMVSAIVGALGALKGPLHGGAPGPALDMVLEIGVPERAEAYLRERLDRGERLMVFGHRVYKVRDPRADILSLAAKDLYSNNGNRALFELVLAVEKIALKLLEEYKPGRRLQTNVEFYTALLLHGLGLATELFTPVFALGRVAGWTAHCFEQQRVDRIIRPKAIYVGSENRRLEKAR